jgi:DNA polymerase III alpha subunit
MDIDIDFSTKFVPQTLFPQAVTASMVKDNILTKHPCGEYFQAMARDGITGLAAIPYEEAEVLGYTKIDFLHLSILDFFTSKAEVRELMHEEPDWSLLHDQENVEKLFQLHNHFNLVEQVRPTSVQELADCITLIRPGKKHLLNQYLNDRTGTRKKHLYAKTADGYSFKRSHAISYAFTIILQLHLLKAGKL